MLDIRGSYVGSVPVGILMHGERVGNKISVPTQQVFTCGNVEVSHFFHMQEL